MTDGLNFISLQVSGKKTEDRAGMGEIITAWTMCLQRFRQSIPANTARLFRELISSRKPENLYEPFLNTWKLRMIFSNALPATAVLTISAKDRNK